MIVANDRQQMREQSEEAGAIAAFASFFDATFVKENINCDAGADGDEAPCSSNAGAPPMLRRPGPRRKTWHRRSQLLRRKGRYRKENREEGRHPETRKRRTEPDSDICLFSSALEPAFLCANLGARWYRVIAKVSTTSGRMRARSFEGPEQTDRGALLKPVGEFVNELLRLFFGSRRKRRRRCKSSRGSARRRRDECRCDRREGPGVRE
jgi:hypothetical protein